MEGAHKYGAPITTSLTLTPSRCHEDPCDGPGLSQVTQDLSHLRSLTKRICKIPSAVLVTHLLDLGSGVDALGLVFSLPHMLIVPIVWLHWTEGFA